MKTPARIPATLAPQGFSWIGCIESARKRGKWDFETVPALISLIPARRSWETDRIRIIESIVEFVQRNPQRLNP
jgi:hypothetical protein